MTTRNRNHIFNNRLAILFGAGILLSYFFPWVLWEGNQVRGYDLPGGYFFSLAETKFKLGNPFPQFDFTFLVFWLIPAGALASVILIAIKKNWSWPAFVTGALSLSLVAVFFLFTQKLMLLGVGRNIFAMMQPAAWVQTACAIGLISMARTRSFTLLKKTAWILAGPVFVFLSFLLMEKHIMGETFSDTAGVKADFSVSAADLFHEFAANDSAANKKYLEKIVSVTGTASEVDTRSDSTVAIKFIDSTGSFMIFSLEKDQYDQSKNINAGETVSVKGSCSGSVFIEILSTTQISFKRSTLHKQL